ncbi:MAG: DUF1800 family protein [Bacteroidetes bacterium]|jgi:uncharacterized protein (DUF1800 family)|nr:DUF1800 family protein [Bacteroidota bacterium]
MASLNEHTTQLGRKLAAHLLRRATFGPTIDQINEFASYTPAEAFTQLTQASDPPKPPIDPATGEPWVLNTENGLTKAPVGADQMTLINYFKAWYLDVMRTSGTSLKERMTYFLHTHLPISYEVYESSEAIYYQNALYRYYALGNFKELFKKYCIDNATLVYLDGDSNDKVEPNENFAREMFELYSIGKGPEMGNGNYTYFTEQDVQAAAKVLTGWKNDPDFSNPDPDTGIPIGMLRISKPGETELATRHTAETKQFSEAFNSTSIAPNEVIDGSATAEAAKQELSDMIDMIFDQKRTARFICGKLYRFFVYYDFDLEDEQDEITNDIIEELATTFYNNDYELLPVLEQLLKSEHFYDLDTVPTEDDNIGAIIKSPVELILNAFRMFELPLPDRYADAMNFYNQMDTLLGWLDAMRINFFRPYDVAGYPAYHQFPAYNRNWITPNSLANRYYLGFYLVDQQAYYYYDIADWLQNSGHIANPSDAADVVEGLIDYLFPIETEQSRKDYFLNVVFLDSNQAGYWTQAWNDYTSGDEDDSIVRLLLERLFTTLLKTPEYQLF